MNQNKKSITKLARELRKNPTDSERFLWEHLRKRRLGGYRFVRQKPFLYERQRNHNTFYIADFYCAQKETVIEMDGKIHDYQKQYDYDRDLVLKELGLSTLRIRNGELRDIEVVKRRILDFMEN